MSQRLYFGDLIFLNIGTDTLINSSSSPQPYLVSPVTSLNTPFHNCVFQILSPSPDPIPSIVKTASKFNIAIRQGTPVMFYHLATGTLLSVETNPVDPEHPKRFMMANAVADSTIFLIHHTEDVIVEGGGIEYDQPLYIRAIRTGLSLVRGKLKSKKQSPEPSEALSTLLEYFPKIAPRRDLKNFAENRHALTLSNEASVCTLTRFQSIDFVRQESKVIANGEYVRIRYQHKWLAFYPNQDNNKEVYFEKINDSFQSYNYLHTIFQILDETSIKGDPIDIGKSKSYVFKHFLTGRILHSDTPANIKAYRKIRNTDKETPYFTIETTSNATILTEKIPLRFKSASNQGYDSYLKPTEPKPVKNVRLEMNTVYFFGFKIPEEYAYRNQKNLMRNLAGLSTEFEEEEGHNIALEKISIEEIMKILKFEEFTNDLDKLVSLSYGKPPQDIQQFNTNLIDIGNKCEVISSTLYRRENIKDVAIAINTEDCNVDIIDRHSQALLREFRIFDLIHMINLIYIKTNPKILSEDSEQNQFNPENFLELYLRFTNLILAGLDENPTNRFYNSQFVRVYINSMLDEDEGVFVKPVNEALKHRMKKITLSTVKTLLWDDDLDALGQLNYYVSPLLDNMSNNKNYQTYYLELLEHISSSNAYNLVNTYRDTFITTFLSTQESSQKLFPVISLRDEKIYVSFYRNEAKEYLLAELHQHQDAYDYFIAALKTMIALSTSKLVRFYHTFIKLYPLNILQEVLNQVQIRIEIKMLVHTVLLFVHSNYLKISINTFPITILSYEEPYQKILDELQKEITQARQTCIGSYENSLLEEEGIRDDITEISSQLIVEDYSKETQFLQAYLTSSLNHHNIQIGLFYIREVINNESYDINFLRKAHEVLIKLRKELEIESKVHKASTHILKEILSVSILVNKKTTAIAVIDICDQILVSKSKDILGSFEPLIAALKKEQIETFAPFNLISLHRTVVSSKSVEYLKESGLFEEYACDEIDKVVIASTMDRLKILQEILSIVLPLNKHVRNLKILQEKNSNIDIDGQEYANILELLEKLFVAIYNPSQHFRFHGTNILEKASINNSDNPTKRFLQAFRKEKTVQRDLPFDIKPEAVSRFHQRIYSLLSIHELLLTLLSCSLSSSIVNPLPDSPIEKYFSRLVLAILTAFVSNNRNNQNLLLNNQNFIRRYYEQSFLNVSCDSLILFGEVLRDNAEIIEVEKKFLYEIAFTSFIGTVRPRLLMEGGTYLCAGIMSMHFLYKAHLPKTIYDTFSVIEDKFKEIITQDFDIFGLLRLIKDRPPQPILEITVPESYYNIKEALGTIASLIKEANKEGKEQQVSKLRTTFNCSKLFEGFTQPAYCFHFDLKNNFLKCIAQMNLSGKNFNSKFLDIDELPSSLALISYLLNEIMEYILYVDRENTRIAKLYEEFPQLLRKIQNTIGDEDDESTLLKDVRKHYQELKTHSLDKINELIFLDEIPVSVTWEHLYIFDYCWKFLAKLCISYPEVVKAIKLLDIFLTISEELIKKVDVNNIKILPKLKKYFTKMKTIKEYQNFSDRINEIINNLTSTHHSLAQKAKNAPPNEDFLNILEESVERKILDTIIEHLKAHKQHSFQTNLNTFASILANHSKRKIILSQLLMIIQHNPTNLHQSVTAFTIQLLSAFLQNSLPSHTSAPHTHTPEIAYAEFHNIQTDLSDLDAERRLVEGIRIIKDADNMMELFKLILAYVSGTNLRAIQNLKNRLNELKHKLLSNLQETSEHEAIIAFILEETLRMAKAAASSEANEGEDKATLSATRVKLLDYCLRSHSQIFASQKKKRPEDEEEEISKGKKLFIETEFSPEVFESKLTSFFEKQESHSDKNLDIQVLEETLGSLPVTIGTIEGLFRVNSNDNDFIKEVKQSISSLMRESEFEGLLIKFFEKRVSAYWNILDYIRMDGLLLLDLYISNIKYPFVVSSQ